MLFEYFYDDIETLYEDWEEFAATPFFLSLGLDETMYNSKRLKICAYCGKPFWSVDVKNKMKYCQRETYGRYNLSGQPFPSTVAKRSQCFMNSRRERRKNGAKKV